MIALADFAEWMKYSISAHNSQPFLLAQKSETIQVWVDPKRLLPVADPHNKDLFTSLGALFETLVSFASAKNMSLEILRRSQELSGPVLEFKVVDGRGPGFVNLNLYQKRFSYRGVFNQKIQKKTDPIVTEHAFLLQDTDKKKQIAQLFDEVNWDAMISKGYVEELYEWLRFEPSHPRWTADGLNSESMALSGIENWGASKILKPDVFRLLGKLGVAKAMIAEAPKITSSLGLYVIWADAQDDAFACGRIFQREWVNLTGFDLFGAPLSVLTDREDKSAEVKKILGLQSNQKLVNILRVGFLDRNYVRYEPARKSAQESLKK